MHLLRAILLLSTATTLTLASPLPQSLAEIERRWSAGETEASIHHGRTHRDATPAWPVQRDADAVNADTFAYATDERTMLRAQRQKREETTPNLLQKMKKFVQTFYRHRGVEKGTIVAARAAEVEDAAPVLKPKKGMRYAFTA